MVTVKMLKPYYVKTEEKYIRIILAYQYFSIIMNKKVYQFIPVKSTEVRINRKTKKIENIDDVFAFQKGKEVLTISMSQLVSIPGFLEMLHRIAESYYLPEDTETVSDQQRALDQLITELEYENVRRLIDKAIDSGDKEAFLELTNALNDK
ncbi:IDEAL domain-containing protein [Oceanobacillus sojae]|uniref:IDEAL domain-containing protein n=1 Tax=Oceanobacillus sojae TaxID=582851 RepID=UPI0009886138|nr:IDEAL domain-containing protein [Oceanobacillus sojae]MCT1902274.1 IDEAL domain-containing protein [Oceanobacillus sojae]